MSLTFSTHPNDHLHSLAQIHEATQGVSLSPDRSHLSMLEVYMLKHPEMLKKVRVILFELVKAELVPKTLFLMKCFRRIYNCSKRTTNV